MLCIALTGHGGGSPGGIRQRCAGTAPLTPTYPIYAIPGKTYLHNLATPANPRENE